MSQISTHPELRDPPTRQVRVPRGELAVWERGTGDPVLLLHGFPDHAIGLLGLAGDLAAAGFRAIVPALPGYWPSSPTDDGDYAVPRIADDLLALLDEFGLHEVGLVGHDWGAEIAYHLGSRSPERISSLVSLAVPHPAGFAVRRSVFSEQQSAWYAIFLAYAPPAASVAARPAWLTGLAQSWSPGFHREDWPEIVGLMRVEGVMEAVCRYYRADLDASLDLEPVRTPGTIIYGGQDGCIGPVAYADLGPWFERSLTLHLVPHVGHWPHLEDPATVLPQIVDGLKVSS